jgi:hypothetical protein
MNFLRFLPARLAPISVIVFTLQRLVLGIKENLAAHVAILVAIGYYIILGVFGLAFYTWYDLKGDDISAGFRSYVICEARGSSQDCEIDTYDSLINRLLLLLTILVMTLLPIVAAIISFVKMITKRKSSGKNFD